MIESTAEQGNSKSPSHLERCPSPPLHSTQCENIEVFSPMARFLIHLAQLVRYGWDSGRFGRWGDRCLGDLREEVSG